MLLEHIQGLSPEEPYYWIRRINLLHGKYVTEWNPEYSPQLVSNRIHFVGALHEHVEPRKPHGIIDYPIIHDHRNSWNYDSGWKAGPAYRPFIIAKKLVEVIRGR